MARANYFYYGTKKDGQKYPKKGFLRERDYGIPDGCKKVLVYNIILSKEDVEKYNLVNLNSDFNMLTRRRIACGITQKELAKTTGLSVRTIQGWELYGISGAALSKAYRVAKVLGCTMEDLLDEEDLNWKLEADQE